MNLKIALVTLCVVASWGAAAPIVKPGAVYFPPLLLCALVFGTGMILLAGLLVTFPKRFLFLSYPKGKELIILRFALVFFLCHQTFGYMAVRGLPASDFAVLQGGSVVFATILGRIVLREIIPAIKWIGLSISISGLFFFAESSFQSGSTFCFFLACICHCSWAIANIQLKSAPNISSLTFMLWSSVLMVPLLVISSCILDGNPLSHLLKAPPGAYIAFLYEGGVCVVLSYLGYKWVLDRASVSSIAPFTLMCPFFGVAVAHLWYGEPLNPKVLLSGLIITVGVVLITLSELRKPVLENNHSLG